jgi:ribonuclease III
MGLNDQESRALQERLGYAFRDLELFARALTHASAKDDDHPSNERLEFLGDAVLGLVVGHFLFHAYPQLEEGALTRVRSAAVSARGLARFARDLELDRAIRLGKGLARDELPDSVLANVLEAVIGAVFLDGGLEAVQSLILWGLAEPIEDELERRSQRNWKSLFQEHTQQRGKITPTYEVIRETGPAHARRFVVAALVDGQERGRGEGLSKKAAEQRAAKRALEELRGEARVTDRG